MCCWDTVQQQQTQDVKVMIVFINCVGQKSFQNHSRLREDETRAAAEFVYISESANKSYKKSQKKLLMVDSKAKKMVMILVAPWRRFRCDWYVL